MIPDAPNALPSAIPASFLAATDLFCERYGAGSPEAGKLKRRVQLIFANPPWGIWDASSDTPLSELHIFYACQTFKSILAETGTIILEPWLNPDLTACWHYP